MNCFNNTVVLKYIYAMDLEHKNVEDLEDNYLFMLEVFRKTKDVNFYKLCSEKVKTNFRFVCEILEIFKDDLEFCDRVARYYLDSLDDQDTILSDDFKEINIRMINLLGNKLNIYSYNAYNFYRQELEKNKICIDISDKDSYEEDLGHGFVFTLSEYGDRKVLTDFIAQRMLYNCLFNDNDLEILLHERFKSIEGFSKSNAIDFLKSVIKEYDSFLEDYVFSSSSNLKFSTILENGLKELSVCKSNWNRYMDILNNGRVSYFIDAIREKISEDMSLSLNNRELINYILFGTDYSEVFDTYCDSYDKNFDINKYQKLSIDDVKTINFGRNLLNKLFNKDSLIYDDELDSNVKPYVKYKESKIIKFRFGESI